MLQYKRQRKSHSTITGMHILGINIQIHVSIYCVFQCTIPLTPTHHQVTISLVPSRVHHQADHLLITTLPIRLELLTLASVATTHQRIECEKYMCTSMTTVLCISAIVMKSLHNINLVVRQPGVWKSERGITPTGYHIQKLA